MNKSNPLDQVAKLQEVLYEYIAVKFWIGFELEIETNLPNNPFRLSDQSFN